MKFPPESRVVADTSPRSQEAEYCCGGFEPDDIVITGCSGRFPLADNIQELSEGLYSKKPFIVPSEERWEEGTFGLPFSETGHLKDITKFDSDFFGFPSSISSSIDPQQRILLEVCYEAIADAGYDPKDLRGRKIGVYSGCSNADGKEIHLRYHDFSNFSTFSGVGFLKCLIANRCSFAFDFHGPSLVIDTACSSSAVALAMAFEDIREGRCDAALVTGTQLCLNPEINLCYLRTGLLTKTAFCRSFDAKADGMARTEGITAVLIQKAAEARRVYCTVMNAKTAAAGYVVDGVYVPSQEAEAKLFEETFNECGLHPGIVDFVEAHGTGTIVGDPIEIGAISDVYCKGRTKPLLVGTIKSNIGHTEAPAALCGIIKAVLAFESGIISPNLNFNEPNPACTALLDGRIKIVVEPTQLTSSYIGVNSFGFGGCNAHIILKANPLEYKEKQIQNNILPRLVLYPASTKEGVRFLLDYVEKSTLPREFFALLQNLAFAPSMDKMFRGYALLNLNDVPLSEIQQLQPTKREVWFVVTGMGCQWSGMGLSLMHIDVFAESMKRSACVLEQFGINLLELLRPDKDHLQQNRKITPAFVTIAAIQIALVDLLNELGIVPDGIVGHSTGELICAYADGCCTAEQTILSAYFRGKAVESANLPDGAMAAVGITWEEAKKRCPENVYAACHNAADSVTISGLKEPLEKFVDDLKKENVFARVVNAYGYAFHCPGVSSASLALKTALKKILPNPKPRTKRWLSTSYPPEEWEIPEANVADASYFVHNLVSKVHFNEALQHIPSDAITIEIGPHFLLQAILKRVIGSNAAYIGLMKRHENNVKFLLTSIGKLYTLGLNPKVEKLYPAVKYPVPRSTPMISNLIKWNHSVTWPIPRWIKFQGGVVRVTFNTDSIDAYLMDHCIEGRSLFPATGYIVCAWRAISKIIEIQITYLPIVVENFKIHRATILSSTDPICFDVSILNVGGEFEIVEGDTIVASGKITLHTSPLIMEPTPEYHVDDPSMIISGQEMYSEMKIHGYEYGKHFQSLLETNIDGTQGLVQWTDKWIPYLDAHLLFFGLLENNTNFDLPTGALSIKIDPFEVKKFVDEMEFKKLKGLPVKFDKNVQHCSSPGVEIRKLKLEPATHRQMTDNLPVLEEYRFVPDIETCALRGSQEQTCVKYIQACSEMANWITQSLGSKLDKKHGLCNLVEIQSPDLENYLTSIEEEHVLLSILKEVAEFKTSDEMIHNAGKVFQKFVTNIGKDILYKTLMTEYPLRPILEIISENNAGKLNVVELSNGCPPLLPVVTDVMKMFSRTSLSCTLIHPEPESLDHEALTQQSITIKTLETSKNLTDIKEQDIVISTFLFGSESKLRSHIQVISALIRNKGFIILFHREHLIPPETFLCTLCDEMLETLSQSKVEKILKLQNLTVICKKSDSLGCTVYLLRRDDPEPVLFSDLVVHVRDGNYNKWVEELKLAMSTANSDNSSRIWIVAEDSPSNGIIGMFNCLRQEPGGEKVRCVFICKNNDLSNPPSFNLKETFYSEVLQKNLLMNVYKDNTWGSFRHLSLSSGIEDKLVEHSFINCAKYGDLSSFHWMESPVKYNFGFQGKTTFTHIYYASLNFRDVMLATGKLSIGTVREAFGNDPCVLGLEYAGITSDGRRVMGGCARRAMATTMLYSPGVSFDVPDHWSLEDAATVPIVYSTCYYALFVRGSLARGEKILIHSGAGGIGIAAIRIALSLDCNIFTTVGTEEKRQYLMKTFPQLKPENIGHSRDVSFENLILTQTEGKGVDVILNSLANEKFLATARCLGKHGRFLEIGKYDMVLDHPLGMDIFLKNTSFHGVLFDLLFSESTKILKSVVANVQEGILSGVVQPLDRTVFKRDEAEKAFRYMASGKHIGKVLLQIRDEERRNTAPTPLKLLATPCLYLYKFKTYIIIGGLGGFGIELTKWLLLKGALNVVITSRYGPRTPYHQLCLRRWKSQGINVTVSTLNVAIKNEAKKLLEEVSQIGPIGGIFNSAVVLKDAFIENQSSEKFEEACAPKASATKNLDELSRSLCPSLDWFVCFSSISCGKGNAGQTNYGYANSVMERICEKRKSEGLHGLAIQWGIIGDVGLVHRHMGEDAMIAGVTSQKVKSCLATLEKFLLQDQPVVCSFVNANFAKKKIHQDDIVAQLAKIFGLKDASEFNKHRSFREMGIDSMIGVEMKQLLESNYDITLSIKDIQEMKIDDFKVFVESQGSKKSSQKVQKESNMTVELNVPKCLVPKASIIPLNSKVSGTPVFITLICEAEGTKLKTLAERIVCPVFGILCTKNTPTKNIEDMALWCLKEISKWRPNCPAHLIGYTCGGNLALQMAIQAQISPHTLPKIETLTLLEGSLSLVNALSGTAKSDSGTNFKTSCLYNFIMQFSETDLPKVKEDLEEMSDLQSQITYVVKLIADSCSELTKNEISDAVYLYLRIQEMTQTFSLKTSLAKDIKIIEPSRKLLPNDVSLVKSILSKICSAEVSIHRVAGGENFISENETVSIVSTLLNKDYEK